VTVVGRKDEVVFVEVYAMAVTLVPPFVGHPPTISETGELDAGTHSIPGLTPWGILVE
jgi:hypothetical protein